MVCQVFAVKPINSFADEKHKTLNAKRASDTIRARAGRSFRPFARWASAVVSVGSSWSACSDKQSGSTLVHRCVPPCFDAII